MSAYQPCTIQNTSGAVLPHPASLSLPGDYALTHTGRWAAMKGISMSLAMTPGQTFLLLRMFQLYTRSGGHGCVSYGRLHAAIRLRCCFLSVCVLTVCYAMLYRSESKQEDTRDFQGAGSRHGQKAVLCKSESLNASLRRVVSPFSKKASFLSLLCADAMTVTRHCRLQALAL